MIKINIREVELQDYMSISRIRKMEGVIENILATKDELDSKMRNKIINRTENDYWYVGEMDGQVVGVGILNRYNNPRKSHTGQITMMVDTKYHSEGVGAALMNELINLSDNILGLKRLELTVFVDNEKAIGLYKKYGFEVEGIKKSSALKSGKYADELMMARVTKERYEGM